MSDTYSYAKIKSIKHTVTAAEASATFSDVTVISGVDFPTDDWIYQINVKDSSFKEKTNGMDHKYVVASGVVNVLNADTSLAEGDIISVSGQFV